MTIKDFIQKTIEELRTAEGNEIPGTRTVEFDIGLSGDSGRVLVVPDSQTRIKFTLEIKRS